MTTVNFQGNETQIAGDLPEVGAQLPEFNLVGTDLSEVTNKDFAGKRLVISLFPSVDTGVCAAQLRAFNEKAAGLDNTVVLSVSRDLPFAQGRFAQLKASRTSSALLTSALISVKSSALPCRVPR